MSSLSTRSSSSSSGALAEPDHHKHIPQPKETLLLGNLPDIDPTLSLLSLVRLAVIHGPIYQLKVPGNLIVIVSSQELVHEVCDEKRFEKLLSAPLVQVRNFAGDGLFTAYNDEKNWAIAHRVLVPAFGPLAIKKMQSGMMDIITQMLMSWEHHAGEPFEAADQFTRLTFDTIGWCAFKYRFNSFHTTGVHPFIDVMVKLLSESGQRARRPGLLNKIKFRSDAEYQTNITKLHEMCDAIVAARRVSPDPEAHDLLNNMINDRDPTTGEHLSDENIRYQMVTFLIAGHETTSGLLSFTTYYLLKNPRVLVKAREEADRAVHEAGGNLLAINASKLTYIDAVLKEALRLHSTAPLFTVTAKSPRGEVLPGGYFVKQGQSIGVLLHQLHRDPKVWGADAEEFRPERFLEGTYPPDSFKPFGNGARACIGRLFAVQEALLTVALMLHRFDLEMADPTYDLHLKQTLTIKPLDFKIVARPRFGRSQSLLMDLLSGSSIEKKAAEAEAKAAEAEAAAAAGGEKLTFLYGSNSGSCEGLARELAAEGASKGFSTAVGELDSVAGSGKLPTSGPVIICTASYEGKPTDNARLFVESITAETDSKSLKGVRYAVFGAGHHDWVQTFHKVPKFIDDRLEQLGAERLMPLTTADAGGDIVGDFEGFKTKVWDYFGKPVMAPKKGEQDATTAAEKPKAPQQLRIRVLPPTANPAATIISAGVETVGVVASQNVLVQHDTAHSQKNHIAIRLPEGQTYRSGDYLAILPKNPPSAVARALKRFDLKEGSTILLSETTSFIPTNAPIRAGDLFSSFVELGQPASRRSLEELASRCEGEDKAAVKKLVDAYAQEIIAQRVSLLDVFEKLPGHKADLSFFIENLPKMKIRQYSISSTPLVDPEVVTLTYSIHSSATACALGVASNYLASLQPSDSLQCAVKSSAEFHLPTDPSVPIVLFAAGTGLAPFRGFLEERALQHSAGGRKVGHTLLFYGCRDQSDMLHADELEKWVREGVLDLRPVFSRSDEGRFEQPTKLVNGTKYVQDRVWEDRDDVRNLFREGAMFYTCGSGARMAADLKKVLINIIQETNGCDADTAQRVMDALSKDRYRTDVFL